MPDATLKLLSGKETLLAMEQVDPGRQERRLA
jgi:hypothetical protein